VATAVYAQAEEADGVAGEVAGPVPKVREPAGGEGDRADQPILRGWVNYFAVGHSSRCFAFIQDWVEKKTRRHLMRARKRRGFGWKRWSREWLYNVLGLFDGYRVRPSGSLPKVAPAR